MVEHILAKLMKLRLILGLFFHLLIPGSDAAILTPPSNKAVLSGTTRVNISCSSDRTIGNINWNFAPVGGSYTLIAAGSSVDPAYTQFYAAEQSGSQSNLIILSATSARAGTYICSDSTTQQAYAQLIVINSDSVCTANASTEVLWNESVQMSCSISFTANISYVNVIMSWSEGDPATIVASGPPVITGPPNLLTAVSTITQTAGYVTPFPMYSSTTSFTVSGYPSPSSNNAPDYSKSTPVFSNSPPNVIYLKPADTNSIQGAKDGEKVYLGTNVTCSVEANPPANYSWRDVGSQNTTYSPNIQIWHKGEYICTASNRVGSTAVSINVTTYTTTAASTTSTTIMTTAYNTSATERIGVSQSDSGGLSVGGKIGIGVSIGVCGILVVGGILYAVLGQRCQCIRRTKPDDNEAGKEFHTITEGTDPPISRTHSDNSNFPQYESLKAPTTQIPVYEQLTTSANVDAFERSLSNSATYENFLEQIELKRV